MTRRPRADSPRRSRRGISPTTVASFDGVLVVRVEAARGARGDMDSRERRGGLSRIGRSRTRSGPSWSSTSPRASRFSALPSAAPPRTSRSRSPRAATSWRRATTVDGFAQRVAPVARHDSRARASSRISGASLAVAPPRTRVAEPSTGSARFVLEAARASDVRRSLSIPRRDGSYARSWRAARGWALRNRVGRSRRHRP